MLCRIILYNYLFKEGIVVKSKFKILCILITVFSIKTSTLIYDQPTTNFKDLFDQVDGIDGAEAEALSYSLGNEFIKSPQDFIESASRLTDNKLGKVCSLLVSYFIYDDFEGFISIVDDLEDDSDLSEDCRTVLECINITINTLQNNKTVSLDDDTTFSGSTFEAAPFDQSTIMGFIENNLKSNRYEDELFNHTIATVYELDSEAFVKMISDLDNDEISSIAKSIALGYYKNNSSFTPKSEKEILVLIQENKRY